MIRKITFQNYKSFKKRQSLEIKPITILVGPNSAGKSSIIKLFALLSQSLQITEQEAPLIPYTGPLVDMGDFRTILNQQCPDDDKIRISLEVTDGRNLQDNHPITWELSSEGGKISFSDDQAHLEIGDFSFLIEVDENFKKQSKMEAQAEFMGYADLVTSIITRDQKSKSIYINASMGSFDNFADIINWILYSHPMQFEIDDMMEQIVIARDIEMGNSEAADRNRDYWVGYPIYRLEENYEYTWGDDSIGSFRKIIRREYEFFEQRIIENHFAEIGDALLEIIKTQQHPISKQLMEFQKSKKITRKLFEAILDFVTVHPDQRAVLEKFTWRSIQYFMDQRCLAAGFRTMDHLRDLLKMSVDPVVFLGPLRPTPKRFYNAADLIDQMIGRKTISMLQPKNYSFLIKGVNRCLQILDVNYTLTMNSISNGSYSLTLSDGKSQTVQNYTDVGFGFSQIIPIFFALEVFRNVADIDPIILIEQPELHLHPRPQARLAEVFTNSLKKSTEETNGEPNRTTTLIETHSEHLVRGFQVMVAQGKLSQDEIAVYYIDKDEQGNSFVQPMPIDENGSFTVVWPDGFFDQGYQQAIELMTARKK